jgi:two-component system sensor histidine kinase UhpB
MEMVDNKGNTRFGLVSGVLDGEIITTITVDITERKQIEASLRESEEKVRMIINSSPFAITVTDLEGNITECNQATVDVHGFANKEELIGRSCLELFSPADLERSRKNLKKTLKEGYVRNVEYTLLKKDRSEFPAELSASVIEDADGVPQAFVAITTNITERKQSEEELLSSQEQLRKLSSRLHSLKEEERAKIALEIHDELGQSLTALKMNLSLIGRKLPAEQVDLSEKVKSLEKLVDKNIQTVKRITTELRPRLLDDLGLIPAIEWQSEDFQLNTGIECKIVSEPEDLKLDRDRSTAIFRIFQEALTNVLRHSGATRVDIKLLKDADKLVFTVYDNGVGITKEQVSNPHSLGIFGMKERVYQWSGEVIIRGMDNEGTRVTVTIPLGKKGKVR